MKKKTTSQNNTSIAKLQQQVSELENKWKRAVADYQNLEKRISRQQSDFVRFASASLIDKLLVVLDDLERAASHIKENGLKLIIRQFKDVLETEGVKPITALNQPFNPETMDAVEMVEGAKNIVVEVVTKGYLLNDRVLRPAKVKVGSGVGKKHQPSQKLKINLKKK